MKNLVIYSHQSHFKLSIVTSVQRLPYCTVQKQHMVGTQNFFSYFLHFFSWTEVSWMAGPGSYLSLRCYIQHNSSIQKSLSKCCLKGKKRQDLLPLFIFCSLMTSITFTSHVFDSQLTFLFYTNMLKSVLLKKSHL